jgi:hypothetical protein
MAGLIGKYLLEENDCLRPVSLSQHPISRNLIFLGGSALKVFSPLADYGHEPT